MRKDVGKRLRDGITSRLEFDFACERGHSFGEYYLHGAINEIVSAIIDPGLFRLHGSYPHPALNPSSNLPKPGRRREVDFYVENRDTNASSLCLEAKWAGSSHCTWEKILLDLYRLALVKEHSPEGECLFVLAGSTLKVNALMASMPRVRQEGGAANLMTALQIPKNRGEATKRTYRPRHWGVPSAVRDSLPTVPPVIRSTLAHHTDLKVSKWRTFVWRIDGPRETKEY